MMWGSEAFHQLVTPPTIPVQKLKEGEEGHFLRTRTKHKGTCGLCKEEEVLLVLFSASSLRDEGEEVIEGLDLIDEGKKTLLCSKCVGVVNHVFNIRKKIRKLRSELDGILGVIKVWRGRGKKVNYYEEEVGEEDEEENWKYELSPSSAAFFPDDEDDDDEMDEEDVDDDGKKVFVKGERDDEGEEVFQFGIRTRGSSIRGFSNIKRERERMYQLRKREARSYRFEEMEESSESESDMIEVRPPKPKVNKVKVKVERDPDPDDLVFVIKQEKKEEEGNDMDLHFLLHPEVEVEVETCTGGEGLDNKKRIVEKTEMNAENEGKKDDNITDEVNEGAASTKGQAKQRSVYVDDEGEDDYDDNAAEDADFSPSQENDDSLSDENGNESRPRLQKRKAKSRLARILAREASKEKPLKPRSPRDPNRPRPKKYYFCGSCPKGWRRKDLKGYLHHLKRKGHEEGRVEEEERPLRAKDIVSTPGPPFICPEPSCSKQYNMLSTFEEHYIAQHAPEHCRYSCDLCDVKLWSCQWYNHHLDTLKHRMLVMEKEGLKELPIRRHRKMLGSQVKKPKEKKKDDNAEIQICEYCGKCLKSLKEHIRKVHSAEVTTTDTKSGASSATSFTPTRPAQPMPMQRRYTPFRAPPILFSCEECGKQFQRRVNLNKHIRDVHTSERDKADRYPCTYPQCGKVFSFLNDLQIHEQHSHPQQHQVQGQADENISLHCDKCNKTFDTLESRELHDKEVHAGVPTNNIPCSICGKLFPSVQVLGKHKRMIHGESNDSTACPVCGKTYKTMNRMKRHLYAICQPDPEKIRKWNEYAKSRYQLLRELKPHKCENCGDGFHEKRLLNKHKERGCSAPIRGGNGGGRSRGVSTVTREEQQQQLYSNSNSSVASEEVVQVQAVQGHFGPSSSWFYQVVQPQYGPRH